MSNRCKKTEEDDVNHTPSFTTGCHRANGACAAVESFKHSSTGVSSGGTFLPPHYRASVFLFSLDFQLLVLLRRVKDKRSLLAETPSASRGQWWWLLPLHEILAGLAVSHASVAFYRDSFGLLTSCAGFRRPTVLPWQQFLLKYR